MSPGCVVKSFNPRLRMGGDQALPGCLRACKVSIHASAWEATATRSPGNIADRFNPRLRMGGDAHTAIMALAIGAFQSTPPHGRRLGITLAGGGVEGFNPRLRMGGDYVFAFTPAKEHVSIHASAWEATGAPVKSGVRQWRFNPRLRMGGDAPARRAPAPYSVSIHASAWEATPGLVGRGQASSVSIHASAWEATRGRTWRTSGRRGFNPRLRMGGDEQRRAGKRTGCVSIHASAWEATRAGPRSRGRPRFNPRLRMGGDWRSYRRATAPLRFNPRLRMGGDRNLRPGGGLERVSIHASAWEATM